MYIEYKGDGLHWFSANWKGDLQSDRFDTSLRRQVISEPEG